MSSLGIEKLKISNFRSYKNLELVFDSIPTVIYGKNGVGKTNLLEAISLLYPGKGVRRSSFHDMINFSNNFPWKVEALCRRNNDFFEVETSSDGKGRVVRIDGKKVPQNSLSSSLKIIWFLPPMDRIWMESSKDRRKFLDRMVFSLDINHAKRCAQYEKLLRDRNRLLKDNIVDSSWYLAIEKEMAKLGFEIDNCRRDFIEKLNTALTNEAPEKIDAITTYIKETQNSQIKQQEDISCVATQLFRLNQLTPNWLLLTSFSELQEMFPNNNLELDIGKLEQDSPGITGHRILTRRIVEWIAKHDRR